MAVTSSGTLVRPAASHVVLRRGRAVRANRSATSEATTGSSATEATTVMIPGDRLQPPTDPDTSSVARNPPVDEASRTAIGASTLREAASWVWLHDRWEARRHPAASTSPTAAPAPGTGGGPATLESSRTEKTGSSDRSTHQPWPISSTQASGP